MNAILLNHKQNDITHDVLTILIPEIFGIVNKRPLKGLHDNGKIGKEIMLTH